MEKEATQSEHALEHPTEAEIDEALEETFPASDPPGWTLGLEPPDAAADEPEKDRQQEEG